MKKILALTLALLLCLGAFSGCQEVYDVSGDNIKTISYEDAVKEMNALLTNVKVSTVEAPIDIDALNDQSAAAALADISTFPITEQGYGQINIEVAAATEFSAEAPDDWMNVVARNFNREGFTVGGQSVSVSVRKITSGEVVTYMNDGGYRPDLYVPSNAAWGKMLSETFNVKTLSERIAGNTAGILMKRNTYDTFLEKYKELNVGTAMEATLAGDISFAYTNPYTSSTGLNILTAMLAHFDPANPVSAQATEKLVAYQRQSPPVAYTTAVLRNAAAKGVIDAMVMEEQSYVNTPELRDYVYVPQGIRHDHPVYTFDYVSQEKQEAARLFVDYCLREENQKLATEKGFNRHDDYKGTDSGLDGAGYLAAQRIWKQNKNGGQPVIAVFVADVSGSMRGTALRSLQESLVAASAFIGSENYVGLISYSDNVTVNLPIGEFDANQRAKFSGAVKALSANGSTATYDAVMQATKMLLDKQAEVPNAKLMMFVLSDGEQNVGVKYERIPSIVKALAIPVYTIGYNMSSTDELKELAGINEAALINASSEDVVNQLRNLFNTQL